MKIDKRMNLVVTVETDAGEAYVHSTPISETVFDRYFIVISQTFTQLYKRGLDIMAGPRVAAKMLKKVATDLGEWEDVERGLLAEIHRLTNVVVLGPSGWETLPLQDAVTRKAITEEDVAEVDGFIVFFTLASVMHTRSQSRDVIDGMCSIWGMRTTSSNCTEYARSLPTSTAVASSGATAAASSVPS